MKSLDLFQKTTSDNASRPTLLGAMLSSFAISLIVYVLYGYLHEFFFKPVILRNAVIFQDKDGSSKISANLGLIFPKLPCPIISVDQEDLIGHHEQNIDKSIVKIPIDKDREPNGNHFGVNNNEMLKQSINKGDGCIIDGSVFISKVEGDIHISFHEFKEAYNYMINHNLHKKISMAHSFSLLNFGDSTEIRKVLKIFQMEHLEKNFNRVSNLPHNEEFNYEYDFEYYIKIIPQIFEDKHNSETTIAYQYSVTYKAKHRIQTANMPIILINYDFSPVAIKYTLEIKSFSHLLTSICALVGGIFVIFSIINSVLLRLLDSVDKNN